MQVEPKRFEDHFLMAIDEVEKKLRVKRGTFHG
jgi:hypothetical protein